MNIVAWGNDVPWAEQRQVEQDLIISRRGHGINNVTLPPACMVSGPREILYSCRVLDLLFPSTFPPKVVLPQTLVYAHSICCEEHPHSGKVCCPTSHA